MTSSPCRCTDSWTATGRFWRRSRSREDAEYWGHILIGEYYPDVPTSRSASGGRYPGLPTGWSPCGEPGSGRTHVPTNAVLDLQDSHDRRVCLRNGGPRPNTAEGHDRSSGMLSQKMAPSSGCRWKGQFHFFCRSFSASPASSRTISRAGFTPFTPPTDSPAN